MVQNGVDEFHNSKVSNCNAWNPENFFGWVLVKDLLQPSSNFSVGHWTVLAAGDCVDLRIVTFVCNGIDYVLSATTPSQIIKIKLV